MEIRKLTNERIHESPNVGDRDLFDPHIYEELKGPLIGIRSYHFDYGKTQYRIAYRILEDKKEIEVVLVKSREGFYQTLRRIIKYS